MLLDGVRAEQLHLAATAHPLGFIHAPLSERPDSSRLRLHLWPKEPFEPQSPAWFVHRHAWPLRSFVVQGKICDRRYRVREAPDGPDRLYEAAYKSGHSVLNPTATTVSWELATKSIEEQGSLYAVPSEAFHASEALAPSVTIAESGQPSGKAPLVIGDHHAAVISYRRRCLERHELSLVISQIIA